MNAGTGSVNLQLCINVIIKFRCTVETGYMVKSVPKVNVGQLLSKSGYKVVFHGTKCYFLSGL